MSPRARRIASDEAHAWARNLRLGDVHAKLVLSMLTLYVDGEGCCFVSIPSLAEDCEMYPDTIRRRLAWLLEIGVISRTPQWLDAQGRRNSAGPGKRTSDLIRLLMPGASPSSQQGPTPSSDEISPSPQQGLNPVSPTLALGQPSHYSQGLISEPEPEQKKEEERKVGLIEVRDEAALRAWDAYGMRTTGRTYLRNKRGGWHFPSEWPPGHSR